jgi:hypothetical protein
MTSKFAIGKVTIMLPGGHKPKKVRRNFRSRAIVGQSKNGCSIDFGFLHIPKTGGSSFSSFSRNMISAGYLMPVRFGHIWSLGDIVQCFPNTKVSFMIRDPLDRTISAFNSRLRQGRPRFSNNWKPREATAFSLFPNVEAYLNALISKEEFDISAVKFAQVSIKHLKWGYVNYFEGTVPLERNRSSIHLVGEVENSIKFWEKYAAQFDIPAEIVRKKFTRKHVAKISSTSILEKFSAAQVSAMKAALGSEYNVYNSLLKLVNC